MAARTLNRTDILRILLNEDRLRILGLLNVALRRVTKLADSAGSGQPPPQPNE